MFKLLRYFSISSACVIGLMTLMVGLTYSAYQQNRLMQRIEVRAIEIANDIVASIEQRHETFLSETKDLSPDALKQRWELTDIDLMVRQALLRRPVVDFVILDGTSRILYSTRLDSVDQRIEPSKQNSRTSQARRAVGKRVFSTSA